MSSTDQDKDWQQIEDEVTCCICGDLFNEPKTIPCLHTFCKRCIERSIDANKKMVAAVSCPLCRAPLPEDEIASIPTNFTIDSLVKILLKRPKQSGTDIPCDNCQESSVSSDETLCATIWCVECEKRLCDTCYAAHSQWAEFKKHKAVSINEFADNPLTILAAPEKPEYCSKHSRQTLDLYCETCGILICRDCTVKDHPRGHRNHNFDFINDIGDEERRKMKQVTDPLTQLLERVNGAGKKIEHCEQQIEVESNGHIEKIRAVYCEVHRLLHQEEQATVETINTIKTSMKKRLNLQKENAKLMEIQLASCGDFCTKIMAVNRTRQMLTYKKWIKTRVDELTKEVKHTSLDPECKASDIVVKLCNPTEFVNNPVCAVSCVPYLPHCSYSKYGQLVRPDKVKVTVTLRDYFGSLVVNQSESLKIQCNKGREFLQNVHIEEHSGGQYYIWYKPRRMEDHLLSVYWRESLVNHEEIEVLVRMRDYANIKQKVIKVIDKYGQTNKQLVSPNMLAKGLNNEVIVRDSSTNQLVVFDKHFQFSHVIGGAGSGKGKFQFITGIAVDKWGCLYVADSDLNCVQKLNMNGEFITQFGCQGQSFGEFQCPRGLHVSQSELLFVCDRYNHRIQVFQDDEFSYCFGQHGTEPGTFGGPVDLTLNNSEDQLFVTDFDNQWVQMFTPKGQFLKVFCSYAGPIFKAQNPVGIYYTPDGYLLVSSTSTHGGRGLYCVSVFDDSGNIVACIDGNHQGRKRFRNPCGVVVMDSGQIVIADGSFGGNMLVVI